MKRFGRVAAAAIAVCVCVGMYAYAGPARGAESSADVETDHVDAVDEGGPRYARLAVQPLLPALGLAVAEADVAIAEHVAVSGALAWLVTPSGSGYRASAGAPVFPAHTVFHGLYVHPRIEWTRLPSATSLGAAATLGYAWTWPFGATTSFGIGLAYTRGAAVGIGAVAAVAGFEPRFDTAVGWLF